MSCWEPFPAFPKFTYTIRSWPTKYGDDFMKYWYEAEQGRLDPFVLVVEGSIPNERIKKRRLLGRARDQSGYRTADHHLRMDRPAGAQGHRGGGGGHVRHLRRNPCHAGQSDRLHGPGGLPGMELEIESRPADRQRAGLSGAAGQLHGDAALSAVPGGRSRADDPAGRPAAAQVAVRNDGTRRLRPRRLLRAGAVHAGVRQARVPGEDRLLGSGGQLQCDQARLDGRHRRLPQRRRHLHRLHDAGLPG